MFAVMEGISTGTGRLIRTIPITGETSVLGDALGRVTNTRSVAGQISGSSTLSADLFNRSLVGISASTSSAVGGLSISTKLSGSCTGIAAATADISVHHNIYMFSDAPAGGVSASTASLSKASSISGVISSVSSLDAAKIVYNTGLSGVISGTSATQTTDIFVSHNKYLDAVITTSSATEPAILSVSKSLNGNAATLSTNQSPILAIDMGVSGTCAAISPTQAALYTGRYDTSGNPIPWVRFGPIITVAREDRTLVVKRHTDK